MSIKLIALDLDGTLLNNDHYTISDRNIQTLRRAAERGIHIVPTTGRALDISLEVLEQLGCAHYAITSNGAAVLNLNTGERLWDRSISAEKTMKIIRIMESFSIALEIYHQNKVYVDANTWTADAYRHLPPQLTEVRYRHNTAVNDLKVALTGRTAEKINVDGIPTAVREQIWSQVQAIGDLVTTASSGGNMEINRGDANKGEALKFLCETLGLEAQETMAFGDGENDVQMLRWVGMSFSMANGAQKAKEAAGHQTHSNEESGVAQIVEQYVLTQPE